MLPHGGERNQVRWQGSEARTRSELLVRATRRKIRVATPSFQPDVAVGNDGRLWFATGGILQSVYRNGSIRGRPRTDAKQVQMPGAEGAARLA